MSLHVKIDGDLHEFLVSNAKSDEVVILGAHQDDPQVFVALGALRGPWTASHQERLPAGLEVIGLFNSELDSPEVKLQFCIKNNEKGRVIVRTYDEKSALCRTEVVDDLWNKAVQLSGSAKVDCTNEDLFSVDDLLLIDLESGHVVKNELKIEKSMKICVLLEEGGYQTKSVLRGKLSVEVLIHQQDAATGKHAKELVLKDLQRSIRARRQRGKAQLTRVAFRPAAGMPGAQHIVLRDFVRSVEEGQEIVESLAPRSSISLPHLPPRIIAMGIAVFIAALAVLAIQFLPVTP